jgi:hypothetical protein
MMSSNKQSRIDRTLSLAEVATIVAGMACAETFGESLFQWFYGSYHEQLSMPGLWLTYLPVATTSMCIAFAAAYAFKIGSQRFMSIGCGITFVYLVVANFRGSVMWQGFYDQWQEPRNAFHLALALSLALGWTVSRLFPEGRLRDIAIFLAITGTGAAWFDANRRLGIYSELAYVRHVAVSILFLILVVCLVANAIVRSRHEESVLTY